MRSLGFLRIGIALAAFSVTGLGVTGEVLADRQVCGDGIWEVLPCEFCGQDGLSATGVPEMNHDCIQNLMDFAYFGECYGDSGQGLSGDFNGDWVVDLTDFALFAQFFLPAYGLPVPNCDPCGMVPDSCAGTIRLNFSDNPEEDIDVLDIQPGQAGYAFVVVEECPGMAVATFGITSSANVYVTGTEYYGPLDLEELLIYQIDPTDPGPYNIAGLSFIVFNSQPAWIRLTPTNVPAHDILWGQFPLGRTMEFELIAHAGINGPPPPDSTGCSGPQPDLAACCLPPRECHIVPEEVCLAMGGEFHPDWPECLPSICHENGPPCPPAGDDSFAETHAVFLFEVPGLFERRPIVAAGPTTVVRQQPEFLPEGNCIIETEIVELSLTGVYDPGSECTGGVEPLPVVIELDPTAPTLGTIISSYDGLGYPDFPAESFFDVSVQITIDGQGPFPHTINLGNLLTRGDLWGDPPCVDPDGPYQAPSNDHAHIPCPPVDPPTGCCLLPPDIGDGCFMTYELVCTLLGGVYLGDGVPCLEPGPCTACGPGPHWVDQCAAGTDIVTDQAALVGIDVDMDPLCTADLSMILYPCPPPEEQVVIQRSDPLDDSQHFPGLRPIDGHLDVIDTEILSMCLAAGGVTLRVGGGTTPSGAVLQPSLGAIAEMTGDPFVAESFFDVYFEVDLGGGVFAYNHAPLRIGGEIDCVPPQVGYIHIVDCLPLYDAPAGGQLVAHLTAAEHVVNPGPDPHVCCFEYGQCLILPLEACLVTGGLFHPEWNSCEPNPCPQLVGVCCDPLWTCTITTYEECMQVGGLWNPEWDSCEPSPCPIPGPCEDCGPGNHWIDTCNAGTDSIPDQAAKVGIDLDLDPNCIADISMVMLPCPVPNHFVTVQRSNPLDDSQHFPGLRPVDGHLDVIDTEILSMCLTRDGVTLRAGGGLQPSGAVLQPSLGAIAELATDPTLGSSIFHVYFEVDLGGGNYLYNHEPMIIGGWIDCVPPQVGYIHIVDCLPLYTDPAGGQHVANLTSAEHVVNPGPEEHVCCIEEECQILPMELCLDLGGVFHPQWDSCDPNPCAQQWPSAITETLPHEGTVLFAAVPNPFTRTTVLKYFVAQPGQVTLNIFDASGRLVRHLLTTSAGAGFGAVEWDGSSDAGARVGRGVYFARLSAGGEVRSVRMITLE